MCRTLPPELMLDAGIADFDLAVSAEIFTKGVGERWCDWSDTALAWHRTTLQLPHHPVLPGHVPLLASASGSRSASCLVEHDAEATRIYLHPALPGCGRPVIGWRCRTYVNGATHPLRPPSRVQCWAALAGLLARYSLPSSAIHPVTGGGGGGSALTLSAV